MACKGKPKPPISESQRRWAFAAEDRGQLPSGTAMKWSRRVEGKDLPMEKKGMFFEDRLCPEDAMFMKCAEPIGSFVDQSPKSAPRPAQTKPIQSDIPSTGVPTQQEAATATPSASMGCGGKLHKNAAEWKEPLERLKKLPGTVAEKGIGHVYEGGKRGIQTAKKVYTSGKRYISGQVQKAPEYASAGLKKVEDLPPWAHAAILGAGGVYTYSKAKSLIKQMAKARNVPPPPDSVISNAIKKMALFAKRIRGK